MPDTVDLYARVASGAAVAISCFALWLNFRKDRRDIAAMRPRWERHFAVHQPRMWKITVQIFNPLDVPVRFRGLEHATKQGLSLSDEGSFESFEKGMGAPVFRMPDSRFIADDQIKPKSLYEYVVYGKVGDEYPFDSSRGPDIYPLVDGYDLRPSFFSRLRRRMRR